MTIPPRRARRKGVIHPITLPETPSGCRLMGSRAAPAPADSVKFTVHDPQYEPRVRQSFAMQRAMETIGARLVHVAPGEVDIELPFRDDLTQQDGFLHAGIVSTVLDSACGYAAYTLMPAGTGVLSIEFKVNLLAPALGERVVARGRVVRAGRTITVAHGDAFALRNGEERHVATMTATLMTVAGRDAVSG
jgi:uncharacterized protein (TIGR00369 family)